MLAQATPRTLAAELRRLVEPDIALRCLELVEREVRRKDDDVRRKDDDVRRKDDDVRRKDDDVRRKDDDVRRKDGMVSALTAALREIEVEHERVKAAFRSTRTDLLSERGLLHMRGVIEYIESHEAGRIPFDPFLEREQKWAKILEAHPALARGLLQANPTKKKSRSPAHQRAASLVPGLFDVLSQHAHPVVTPESARALGPVTVSSKKLHDRLADMVACMCKYYYIDFDRLSDAGDIPLAFRSTKNGLPRRAPKAR